MNRLSVNRWCIALGLLVWTWGMPVWSQDQRDPTLPPVEAGTAPVAGPAAQMGLEGMSVVLRDGKPLLMVGTRLYAPGQSVGAFKIDRISETEVWLRDSAGVRKIPRFAGIQRTAVVAKPACKPVAKTTATAATPAQKSPSRPVKTTAKTLPATPLSQDIPCEGIQP